MGWACWGDSGGGGFSPAPGDAVCGGWVGLQAMEEVGDLCLEALLDLRDDFGLEGIELGLVHGGWLGALLAVLLRREGWEVLGGWLGGCRGSGSGVGGR